MTDKEIIKALECCTNNEGCLNCPLQDDYANCNPIGAALDLINRQQAEIENYIKVAEYQQNLTLKKSFEIKELKAEIERLEIKIEGVQEANAILREHIKKAVKEFAERLKEKLDCDVHTSEGFYFMVSDTIDNLVKEMGCE